MKGYIPERNKLAGNIPGYKIKYYRIKSGLTQNELGKLCGLNGSTIKNYELNNRTPDTDNLSKIADALGISIFALSDTDLKNPEGAIHALFDLEKLYGLHPEIVDGKICLVTDIISEINPDADKNRSDILSDHIVKWADKLEEALSEKNCTDNYYSWQAGFKGSIDQQ